MALDLPHGPWNKAVSGKWSGFSIALYTNPSRHMLLVVFDEPSPGKVQGMLVLLRRAFKAEGDVFKFSAAQRRDLSVFQKTSKAGSQAWVVLSATPEYVPYSLDELGGSIQDQYAELDNVSKTTESVARDYGLKLEPVSNLPEEQFNDLFADPFVFLTLVNPAAERERGVSELGREIVGFDSQNTPVDFSVSSLSATIVIGERESRKPVLRVLCENALKNGMPVLLFTSSKGLENFDKLANNLEELKKRGMNAMPVPFSYKPLVIGKSVFIDLSQVDSNAFLEAFDLQRAEVGAVFRRVFDDRGSNIASLTDLTNELRAAKETKAVSQYQINKGVRIVNVLTALHGGLFSKNVVPELAQLGVEHSGKLVRVDALGYSLKIQKLLLHAIVRTIQPVRGARALRSVVVVEPNGNEFGDVIAYARAKFGENIGLIACGEHDVDLAFFKDPRLVASVIGGDVALQEAGQKPQRVKLRPQYTG
ncbi:MAG TPA: hypothetical protein VGQ00_03845 [Candidatus Norongarragalinales archaeon]|jgi:hypothetical protein|nr:hypothetical protein [Candidatus Norongarragalinales archaeon]